MQIARVNALLTATAAGFSSVFSGAGKAVTSFSSQIASVGTKIGAIGSAIGAGAAVYQIVSLTKASIDSIDKLKDQAEALGVTTEALSRLQYAAQFAGVDAGTMAGAIGKMSKILGDAAMKGGEVATAIEGIGLDAQALSQMQPDAAFAKIAGALSKIENPYQRASIAAKIFGKQWQDLVPILNLGEAGLNRLGAESDKFGTTISAVDAAKIEAAADAFTRVSSMITGAANAAAVELAPYLEAVANKLVEIGTAGRGMGGIVVTAIEGVAKGIAYASDFLELFKSGWYLLEAGVLAVTAGLIKSIDIVGQGLADLANLIPGVEVEWTTSFATMADSMANDVIAATQKAADSFNKFSDGTQSKKVGAFFEDVKKKADEAAKAAAEAGKNKIKPIADKVTEGKGPGDISGLLGKFIKDTTQAGTDIINNEKARLFAETQKKPDIPEAPQLLQAGSQAAASFVARAQREQAAKANDPATVAAKTTADNTKRQNELTEQVLSKLSTPVELI